MELLPRRRPRRPGILPCDSASGPQRFSTNTPACSRLSFPLALLLFLLPTSSSSSSTSYPSGHSHHELSIQGATREYEVFVPSTASGAPKGLVVFLHGTGGSGVTDCYQRAGKRDFLDMTTYSNELNVVIVCPTSTRVHKQWNLEKQGPFSQEFVPKGTDDIAFIRAVIEDVQASAVKAPANKVFAMGMSNGGQMTWVLACRLSDVIHGVGIAGAAFNQGKWMTNACTPPTPRPVWEMHGTADKSASADTAQVGMREYAGCLLHCDTGKQQTDVVTKQGDGDPLVSCTEFTESGCKGVSKLCVFRGLGHSMAPAPRYGVELVPSAWAYLDAAEPNPVTTAAAKGGGCIGWQLNERGWPAIAFGLVGVPMLAFIAICGGCLWYWLCFRKGRGRCCCKRAAAEHVEMSGKA